MPIEATDKGWYNLDKRCIDIHRTPSRKVSKEELILDSCPNYQNEISGTVPIVNVISQKRKGRENPRVDKEYIASISAWIQVLKVSGWVWMNRWHIVCVLVSLKSTTYKNNILTKRVKLENLSICQHSDEAWCSKFFTNNISSK